MLLKQIIALSTKTITERDGREDDEHGGGPTPQQNPDKGWTPEKTPEYHHKQANKLHAELGVNGYDTRTADKLEAHKKAYKKLTGKEVDFSKTNKKWGLREGLSKESAQKAKGYFQA